MSEDDLSRAIDALTIFDVWDEAPMAAENPHRCGVFSSPFREDRKPSFSVSQGGRMFKDFSVTEHFGGVWKYVELAHPEWSRGQVARFLKEKAGIRQDGARPRKSAADYRAERSMAQEEARRRTKRDRMTVPRIEPEKLAEIPAPIARKWQASMKQEGVGEWAGFIAQERGWPEDWAVMLVEDRKMVRGVKGEPAFKVEYFDGRGAVTWTAVHQRFFSDRGDKAWFYLPNQKQHGEARAAAPFFVGDPVAPVWIVTEGQWDAATIWGMLGGFEDQPALHSLVCGIRGATGVDVFLALYAGILRARHVERIILVPDADKAGGPWLQDEQPRKGLPERWSFLRRLRELTGKDVRYVKLREADQVKDINDVYRHGGELARARFLQALEGVIA